jgi:predicted XRE-type DNA-binding protein
MATKKTSKSRKRTGERATLIERGSGDVFRDIGFSAAEAANLRLRADLALRVRQYVERSGVTQSQAARAFGVRQPRLNALLRGRLDEFSIDALVNMLANIGERVELRVRRAA